MRKPRFRWFWPLLLATILCMLIAPGLASQPSLLHGNLENPAALEQQGRSLYSQGDFTGAIAAFEQAAATYQQRREIARQAINLGNLALCQRQLGNWSAANQAIAASLALLPRPTTPEQRSALAQLLSIQGNLHLAQGQAQAALDSWQRATQLAEGLGHADRANENRLNQAQALLNLGLPRRSIELLSQILVVPPPEATTQVWQGWLQAVPPTSLQATALKTLGETLGLMGDFRQANQLLQRSLAINSQLQDSEAIASTRLSLANLNHSQILADLNLQNLSLPEVLEFVRLEQTGRRFRNTAIALQFYQRYQAIASDYEQAAQLAQSPLTRIQAQLNRLSLLTELQQQGDAKALVAQILPQLETLPPSLARVYAQINLARSQIKLGQGDGASRNLAIALGQARLLQDQRAEAFALGNLGSFYEQRQQWQSAQTVTQAAISRAESLQAPELTYLWQWQLGRVLRQLGDTTGATAAYQAALSSLQQVRQELLSASRDQQFAFRASSEPLHRQLVELLLDSPPDQVSNHAGVKAATSVNQRKLELARATIESLQLSELTDFFRETCLTASPQNIDQVDRNAAVFYPILLSQRLAVILSLPQSEQSGQPSGASLTVYQMPLSQAQVETSIKSLRSAISQPSTPSSDYLPIAEQWYDWLIRPVAAELEQRSVKTLVFVLDGALRNLPMAVLHDRQKQQYLIQQYSVAVAPGLTLLPESEARAASALTATSALLAGVTEARAGFAALPGVKAELQQVSNYLPKRQKWLDSQFTRQKLGQTLRSRAATIVHLATHGQFSSQLENTFILTYDDRLTLNDLQEWLSANGNQPLDLLVLSACETAIRDSRAALGLAGVAVRAGARTTLATLWQVNDLTTARVMQRFYQALSQQSTKAEALRQAQLSLLQQTETVDYHHLYYWAAYLLIGHWR